MAKKSSNDEIVPFEHSVALADPTQAIELIQSNLGDNPDVGVTDLDRVRVDGSAFVVPTLEGDETTNSVEGIVLHSQVRRAYWPSKDITGEAPQCYSDDGVIGHGNPGGPCASCPLAEFGSAAEYVEGVGADSNAQACKQSRQVFLLTEDSILPKVLSLPPTSLKAFRSYMLALTGRQLDSSEVVTRFDLEKAKTDSGMSFSTVTPKFAGRLQDEQKASAKQLREVMLPILQKVRSQPEDGAQLLDAE